MKLQDAKLVSEAEDSYHIEMPSGKRLTVEKHKLHDKAHDLIRSMQKADVQKFDDGGEVKDKGPKINQDSAKKFVSGFNNPPSISEKFASAKKSLGFSDGGTAPEAAIEPGPATPAQDNPNQVMQDLAASPAPGTTPPSAPPGSPSPELQPPAPVAGSPMQQKVSGFNQGLEAQKAGIEAGANIIGQEGKAEQKAIEDTQTKVAALPTQADIVKKYADADASFEKQLKDQKLDPNRYWHNLGTGSKIAAGIGMILGGIGAGLNGTNQNQVANMIQSNIDRDIEAQKNDQSKTMNLWKMNREALGNDLAANLATQNQAYTALKYNLEKAAAQFKGPMAQANAKQAVAMIQQKQDENRFKLSLMSNTSDVAPEQKVQFLVPEPRQAEVFKEIKRAQDVSGQKQEIMKAYDEMTNSIGIGKHPINTVRNIVGANPSSQTFQALLGTTLQDLEGTVRQAAMDNLKSAYSQSNLDNAEDILKRRKELEHYLDSKSSAPVAKGFGIDLGQYKSTAISPAAAPESITKGPNAAAYRWAKANPHRPEAKKVFEKLGVNQ